MLTKVGVCVVCGLELKRSTSMYSVVFSVLCKSDRTGLFTMAFKQTQQWGIWILVHPVNSSQNLSVVLSCHEDCSKITQLTFL